MFGGRGDLRREFIILFTPEKIDQNPNDFNIFNNLELTKKRTNSLFSAHSTKILPYLASNRGVKYSNQILISY